MPQFILMLRDNGFPSDWTEEQMMACIGRYQQWMQRNGAKGEKLRDNEGRLLVRKDGALTITDGPFAEAREVLGGYMVLTADSYDDAVARCQDSPHLEFGSIEVRQIDEM